MGLSELGAFGGSNISAGFAHGFRGCCGILRRLALRGGVGLELELGLQHFEGFLWQRLLVDTNRISEGRHYAIIMIMDAPSSSRLPDNLLPYAVSPKS